MSLESMRNIWEVLENHQFDIDVGPKGDVACSICRRVLINAQIGPCGCQYCLNCITRYLDEGKKTCSGGTGACDGELLTIGDNVVPHQAANIRLSRMVVKCPEKQCEHKCELRNMLTHIRVCNARSVECPFATIGCKESCPAIASVEQHIHEDVVSHFKLLLESNGNLKNEMELLKREVVGLREENDNLKEDNRTMRADQALMEMRTSETENNNLRKNEELEELKRKYDEIENRLREIEERNDTAARIREVPKTNTKLEITPNENYQTLSTKILNLEMKQEQQNCGEIIWMVDDWREKLQLGLSGDIKWFYSDPFYSHRNGYKMCLAANPYGYGSYKGTHLSFGFCLMKGPFDDILSWPFKGSVIIELIKRSSGIAYKTSIMAYNPSDPDYNKPTNNRNNEIFYYDFLELKQLPNDDKLFVRCKVKF